MEKIKVASEYDGWRIDKFLAKVRQKLSRSVWQSLIKDGKVYCSGKIIKSGNTKISTNELIEITQLPQNREKSLPQPENIPLDILYEDNHIIIINKQAGIIVHPGDGCNHGTIVNALLYKFQTGSESELSTELANSKYGTDPGFLDKQRPGIVHRLDKDTSGILIIAKDQLSLEKLSDSFKERKVKKTYLALIHGHPRKLKDTIALPIGRHPVNRKKMAVIQTGKSAVTHFSIIKKGFIANQPVSLLEVQIETGRTHQIRVHLAEIHFSVIGDKLYGGSRRLPHADRQMLHAWKLEINHPQTGRLLKRESPIPVDIKELIEQMT
jgi:23S rRNA pseudouridine1911/1915/1917 synthase